MHYLRITCTNEQIDLTNFSFLKPCSRDDLMVQHFAFYEDFRDSNPSLTILIIEIRYHLHPNHDISMTEIMFNVTEIFDKHNSANLYISGYNFRKYMYDMM